MPWDLRVGAAPLIERIGGWLDEISPVIPCSLVVVFVSFPDRNPVEAENPCLDVALWHEPGTLLGDHSDQVDSIFLKLPVQLREPAIQRSQSLRLLLHHTSTSESTWLCLPKTPRDTMSGL